MACPPSNAAAAYAPCEPSPLVVRWADPHRAATATNRQNGQTTGQKEGALLFAVPDRVVGAVVPQQQGQEGPPSRVPLDPAQHLARLSLQSALRARHPRTTARFGTAAAPLSAQMLLLPAADSDPEGTFTLRAVQQ